MLILKRLAAKLGCIGGTSDMGLVVGNNDIDLISYFEYRLAVSETVF